MAIDPASRRDDVDAFERVIVRTAQDAVHATTLIEKPRVELAG